MSTPAPFDRLPQPLNLPPGLLQRIRAQYRLEWMGLHGIRHWARVLHNGLMLAPHTGARADVVTLFAIFHDACRHNDDHDPDHGPRGGQLARELHGTHFELDPEGLELLVEACRTHTDGRNHDDPTVCTCWDADRLDLSRVGITPNPRKLRTDAARDPEMIAAAIHRAIADAVPFPSLLVLCPESASSPDQPIAPDAAARQPGTPD